MPIARLAARKQLIVQGSWSEPQERMRHMARKCLRIKAERHEKFMARRYTRCQVCGRSRAVYRKFRLCRICFRNLALEGKIPGVRKASW